MRPFSTAYDAMLGWLAAQHDAMASRIDATIGNLIHPVPPYEPHATSVEAMLCSAVVVVAPAVAVCGGRE